MRHGVLLDSFSLFTAFKLFLYNMEKGIFTRNLHSKRFSRYHIRIDVDQIFSIRIK
jgi:hypothetical protein